MITDFFGDPAGCLAQFFSQLRAHRRRGTLFDQLLVSPLHGTVSFRQVDDFSLFVARIWNLHMSRFFKIFFQINVPVPKSKFCLIRSEMNHFDQSLFMSHNPHSLSAAPARSFYDQRVADLARQFLAVGIFPETLSSEPGMSSTPAPFAIFFASILSPIFAIASLEGPIKLKP